MSRAEQLVRVRRRWGPPMRVDRGWLRRLALSPTAAVVVCVGAVGIAFRVWAYRSALGAPDSDEAIVGLMVRHAIHGELTTFYWGQNYGGTQEVLLAVPLFLIGGSGLLALRLIPMCLSAVTALLIWRIGRRTIGNREAAVAAGLFWVWLPFDFVWLTREYDFYASDVLYCALIMLLALRVVERPDRIRVGLFGLVLGLAFWQTAQIIPVALPVVAWTIWKRPSALRQIWLALPLAALGALPWIVWNAGHGWASVMARSSATQYAHSLRLFVSPLLPMSLGLRAPFSAQALIAPPLMYVAYAGLVLLFVYGWSRSRAGSSSILFFVAACFPLVWALSRRVSSQTSDPMYLVVLSPVLALLLAGLARSYVRALAVIALAGVVCVVTLHRMDARLSEPGQHWPPTVPRDFGPLISTLGRLGLDRVYADYWIAYRLDFDSRERIIAVQLAPAITGVTVNDGRILPVRDLPGRYPPYWREVRAARHGFVLFRSALRDSPLAGQLALHGYRKHPVGPFVVFAP